AVERIQAVVGGREVGGHDDQGGGHAVGRDDHVLLLGELEAVEGPHPPRQEQRPDPEAEQHDAGDGQRCYVERAVFPQLPPQRPEERAQSAHRPAPEASPALPLITATKTSAMLGVRTSPRPASCWRSAPSKSRMLRPKTWRSWRGFSSR